MLNKDVITYNGSLALVHEFCFDNPSPRLNRETSQNNRAICVANWSPVIFFMPVIISNLHRSDRQEQEEKERKEKKKSMDGFGPETYNKSLADVSIKQRAFNILA